MQIDFHHAATYVIARLAGLSAAEAEIVAYSAQYVDDATHSGLIRFDNGAMYHHISPAHRALDYRNFNELSNHYVWVPFHFLPGNGGLPAGQSPPGGFIEKLICWPDSPVAHDLLRACIEARHAPSGLHRLGITLHIYADTWAHQGFSGVKHAYNRASHIQDADGRPDLELSDRLKNYFVNEALPLGHGTVLSNPDLPFLVWSYENGRGNRVHRDNPRDYLRAAERLFIAIGRYVAGDADATVRELAPADRAVMERLFRGLTSRNSHVRHAGWLAAIAAGEFSFGPERIGYLAEGEGSWKQQALGACTEIDERLQIFPYHEGFLRSDWKLFHDAVQAHRLHLVQSILPRYGICVA